MLGDGPAVELLDICTCTLFIFWLNSATLTVQGFIFYVKDLACQKICELFKYLHFPFLSPVTSAREIVYKGNSLDMRYPGINEQSQFFYVRNFVYFVDFSSISLMQAFFLPEHKCARKVLKISLEDCGNSLDIQVTVSWIKVTESKSSLH